MKNYNLLSALLVFIVAFILAGFSAAQRDSDAHHAPTQAPITEPDFAERERTVMPFSLEETLHVFEDTATGGVERVVAKSADDAENIRLIREHLAKEAPRFTGGDFTDPAYLHGETMDGLNELKRAGEAGALNVRYEELPDGAQLIYEADDPAVVVALHLWFQAQVADHGDHAM